MSIFRTRYRVIQEKCTPYCQFHVEISRPSEFWVWREYGSYKKFQTVDEAKLCITSIKNSVFSEVVYKE